MYRPTKSQSLAKSRLHRKAKNNPLLGPMENLPVTQLAKLSGVKDISKWMEKDGFYEWLINDKQAEDIMESQVELGLERMHEILASPLGLGKDSDGVKPGEMIKAVEMLLKYTGRAPEKAAVVQYRDKEIAEMDEARLDKMIDKSLREQKQIQSDLEELVEK